MDTVEQRLAELGLTLPPPARAVGNYLMGWMPPPDGIAVCQ